MPRTDRAAIRIALMILIPAIMGIVLALPKSESAATGREKIIDTGGPVTMSKCGPCHRDLDQLDNPSLINFNHPVHFRRGIECRACHVVFPHQPGELVKPTMDLCANCHRQKHGNQGSTAPSRCDLCHPADFKLTPADHDDSSFAARGHRKPAADDQKCLVCHDGSFCESCHEQKGVKKTEYRWYGLWPEPKKVGDKIKVSGEVTMSSCQACHRDLQVWKNPKLINFNHPIHFKRQIKCDRCHEEWPHGVEKIERPKMTACVQCHRLSHGSQGKLVSAESADDNEYCFLCHPADMRLKPDWHTPEFVGGDHKRMAKADRGLCRGCHVQSFCDSCHQVEIPHDVTWETDHGRVAASLSDQGENLFCFKCHKRRGPREDYQSAPSCAACHKAVVFPHPEPWAPKHGKTAKRVGEESCGTCHVIESFCKKCHGDVKMPHAGDWLGQHRSYLEDNAISQCLTCHQAAQCERCHAIHKVHNQNSIYKLRQ